MFKRLLIPAVALIAGIVSLPVQAADDAVAVMYHRFGEKGLPSTNTTMAQLDAHIAFLKKGKFTVWPLRRIVDAIRKGESLPDKTVAITIDDAYRSVVLRGLPRLKAAGFTATLFVNSEPADSALRGYMSWDDIRKALDDGFDIGAHTVSHAHLADLPLSEVRREINHSNKRFQEELGFVPKLFAYPYGEASLDVRKIIKDAGYIAAFGQHSGVLHKSEDMLYLPRFALNEKYGTINRFRTLASAKSMMASDVTPRNMALTKATNPPAFGFTIDPAIGNFSSLACYASGVGKLTLQRPGGRRIEARLPKRLRSGRHRVNCTLSAGGGRWYWLGRQFYVPKRKIQRPTKFD
ncbi:MAG: polysaccharide deacetylase family protein [Alphaproteobacteria bacterium]